MRSRILYFLIIIAVLSSCRSQKSVVATTQDKAVKTEVLPMWQTGDIATTTGRVTMTYNGRRATLDAHVRLKRDDVVQVQFSYSFIITIQVGTMELTKDEFMFLNRIHKQYTRAPYAEADGFLNRDINFENVQSMFWGDGEGQKPSQLQLALPVSGKLLKANFVFDEWGKDDSWQTRTSFNEQRFDKVSLEQLIQTIINM